MLKTAKYKTNTEVSEDSKGHREERIFGKSYTIVYLLFFAMKDCVIILAIGFALGFCSGSAPAQREVKDENLDSLAHSFQAMTKRLTTPEFERRKNVLRMFQRRGYVQVLSDVVAGDGLSALLSLIKVNAQIEYHLPHNRLVFRIPPMEARQSESPSPWHFLTPQNQPMDIPLIQDWTFPSDPWSEQ